MTFERFLVGIADDSDIPVRFSGSLSKALIRLVCGVTFRLSSIPFHLPDDVIG